MSNPIKVVVVVIVVVVVFVKLGPKKLWSKKFYVHNASGQKVLDQKKIGSKK